MLKQSAVKIGQALEDDDLYKAIGDQLDSSKVDYSQWERSRVTASSRASAARHSSVASRGTFIVSSVARSHASSVLTSKHTCSAHPPRTAAAKKTLAKRKADNDRFKALQLQKELKNLSLESHRRREQLLLESNLKLKEIIEADEKQCHDHVKSLLRNYERYSQGIATLNERFEMEIKELQCDIEQTKETHLSEIRALEDQLRTVDKQLLNAEDEYNTLLNYKDKEYPVRCLTISSLQKELEQLQIQQKKEMQELQYYTEAEREKLSKVHQDNVKEVKELAAEKALATLPPAVKKMAKQNIQLLKDIECHLQEMTAVEEENKALSNEIAKLKKDPTTNIRRHMFPELYPPRQKCTPDTEIILDIPVEEELPV